MPDIREFNPDEELAKIPEKDTTTPSTPDPSMEYPGSVEDTDMGTITSAPDWAKAKKTLAGTLMGDNSSITVAEVGELNPLPTIVAPKGPDVVSVFDAAGNLLADSAPSTQEAGGGVVPPVMQMVFNEEAAGKTIYDKAGNISSGKGDRGGVSYGLPQFPTNTGGARAYVNSKSFPFRDKFKGLRPNTPAFNKQWKALATNPATRDVFAKNQLDYITRTHYTPLVNSLKGNGYDLERTSLGLRQIAFGMANQFGPKGAASIFTKVLKQVGPNADDAAVINGLYKERTKTRNGVVVYFKSSKPNVQRGVVNRFRRETKKALQMYYAERKKRREYASK